MWPFKTRHNAISDALDMVRAVAEDRDKFRAERDVAIRERDEARTVLAKVRPPLYCNFCGKSQYEVKKLIAGPKVHICDECVRICIGIIDDTPMKGDA